MRWAPKPYQKKAVDFVLGQPHAGLFLEPGLGKTSIVLSAFDKLYRREEIDTLFVIAPLPVVYNVWPYEVTKWGYPYSVGILHGSRKDDVAREDHDVWVLNPEGIPWFFRDHAHRVLQYRTMLVVDESTRFKDGSMRKKRFSILREWLGWFERRAILTGTPAPNGYQDLFGQVFLLDQGAALGLYKTRFLNRYFAERGYDRVLLPGAAKEIEDAISPLVLQMSSADYLDLPEQVFTDIELDLPTKAKAEYRRLEKDFFVELDSGAVDAASAGVLSMKLRQVANGAVYDRARGVHKVHDEKLDKLAGLVDEIGHNVIVVYEFEHDYSRIRERFPDAPTLSGVSAGQRKKIVDAWNAGDVPVLCMHPASGGHGLNLQTGGHHMVFYGPGWNLEHYDQVIKRIHRPGQDKPTYYYRIIMRDTVEQVVLAALESKDRGQKGLLSALKTYRRRKR